MKRLIIFLVFICVTLISCSSPIQTDDETETTVNYHWKIPKDDENNNQEKKSSSNDENTDKPQIQIVTITFDFDNDKSPFIRRIEKGKTIQCPQNPTKENYTFVGWYLNDSLFDFSRPIFSDIILKAKWDKIYCTVFFDSDDGTLISPQVIEKGGYIKYFQNPTKENYEFLGWYLGDYLFDFSAPIKSNITLKAKWDKIYFNIDFDSNGGTKIDTLTIHKYDYIKRPTEPKKDFYEFVGWFLNDEEFNFDTTQITEDITLKAKWKPLLEIKFDSDGGTTVDSQYIKYKNKCIIPKSNPTKEGCVFAYWYNEDENIEFDFNSNITKNITLKAKWYRYSCYVGDYNAIDLEYYVNGVKVNKIKCADETSTCVREYINNHLAYLFIYVEDNHIVVEKRIAEHRFIIKDVYFDGDYVYIIYE